MMKSPRQIWLSRLALVGGMVSLGAVAGLLVAFMAKPAEMQAWWDRGAPLWPIDLAQKPWESIFYGVVYATTMWSTILGVRKLLYRYIPVRTWRGLLVHVVANAVMVVAAFSVINVLDPYICDWITGAEKNDGPPLSTVAPIAFGTTIVLTTIMYAFDFFRAMQDAERTALVAELRALRAQINPHFLFNTLNSIAALVHTRPDEAEHVIEELAELFRYTLQASQHPTVTLAEELTATERYLAIEQARFQERMVVTRAIAEDVLDAQVPSLLVQPLVENAVKHGVSKIEDACAIHIEIHRDGDAVRLCVRDTGPGFISTDPAVVFGRGTGLTNVRDRLHLHFGLQAQLTLLADGIALRFPYRPVQKGVPVLSLVPPLKSRS